MVLIGRLLLLSTRKPCTSQPTAMLPLSAIMRLLISSQFWSMSL